MTQYVFKYLGMIQYTTNTIQYTEPYAFATNNSKVQPNPSKRLPVVNQIETNDQMQQCEALDWFMLSRTANEQISFKTFYFVPKQT